MTREVAKYLISTLSALFKDMYHKPSVLLWYTPSFMGQHLSPAKAHCRNVTITMSRITSGTEVVQHFVTFETSALKYLSVLLVTLEQLLCVLPLFSTLHQGHRSSLSKTLYPLDKEINAAFSLGLVYLPRSVHMALSESSSCTSCAPWGALRWNMSFPFDNRAGVNKKFCSEQCCCASSWQT